MTLTQKILADHAAHLLRPWVEAGDMLRIRVDWSIASELAWNGMDRTYTLLGRPGIANPARFYLALDHTVDPVTLANDARTRKLADLSRAFAKESGLQHFYDANVTIMHTKFYRDLVQPGEVVIGADSHTSSHGGLGAFAVGLGGADVTAAMVLGETWIEVPEAIAVEYEGEPGFGIGGKDIILRTLGLLGRNTVAMERTVEYRGAASQAFTTDMRFTICNMTAEFGGLNGIFEANEPVATWLTRRRRGYNDATRYFRADADAPYIARYPIALSALAPQVAQPFSPDHVRDVDQLAGQPLDGAFIGACTTTEEELALAALVLEVALADGAQPHATAAARRIVVPGDLMIEANLRAHGLWEIYQRAGFLVDPPNCSMCLGIASRKAGKGEV
ncbi:MAG: 3-isopropylmalate dehydratase, partial [Ktedonobacterales bacterium]|nr:3-isopropylmalate dehydratase [Ktedonobacterales bacterium]